MNFDGPFREYQRKAMRSACPPLSYEGYHNDCQARARRGRCTFRRLACRVIKCPKCGAKTWLSRIDNRPHDPAFVIWVLRGGSAPESVAHGAVNDQHSAEMRAILCEVLQRFEQQEVLNLSAACRALWPYFKSELEKPSWPDTKEIARRAGISEMEVTVAWACVLKRLTVFARRSAFDCLGGLNI